jgi:type IV secretion system protein VirB9
VPTVDGQPPVCDDGEVTIINFPIGVGFLGGRPSVLRLKDDDTRVPVQFGAINSTYRVTGVHQRLMLQLGAEEVIFTRRDPVSVKTPSANRKQPEQGRSPATAGGGQ